LAEKRSARFDAGSVVKRMVSRDWLTWSRSNRNRRLADAPFAAEKKDAPGTERI
jgi:hypothetical protein